MAKGTGLPRRCAPRNDKSRAYGIDSWRGDDLSGLAQFHGKSTGVTDICEAHVKSLNAIHLATCGLLGSGITVVTHDENMAELAAKLGLEVIDPLSDQRTFGG